MEQESGADTEVDPSDSQACPQEGKQEQDVVRTEETTTCDHDVKSEQDVATAKEGDETTMSDDYPDFMMSDDDTDFMMSDDDTDSEEGQEIGKQM